MDDLMKDNSVPNEVFGRKIAPKYRDRIGAYIIPFDDKGRVGVVKTSRYLLLLGGEIEKKETDEECIKREAIEEVGCSVEVGELCAIGEKYAFLVHIRDHVHFVARCYTGKITAKVCEPFEIDHTLVFMTPEDALKRLFFNHQSWALSVALDKMEKQNN